MYTTEMQAGNENRERKPGEKAGKENRKRYGRESRKRKSNEIGLK